MDVPVAQVRAARHLAGTVGVLVRLAGPTAGGAAQDLPAAAVGDAAELLDVHVHQVPGLGVLVAADLGADTLASGQVHVAKPGQLLAAQDLVHRGRWQADPRADPGRPPPTGAAQVHDLLDQPAAGLGRAGVRAAGPVIHPGLAVLSVAGGPAGRGGHRDLEPFGGATQRPAVIDDTAGQAQPTELG